MIASLLSLQAVTRLSGLSSGLSQRSLDFPSCHPVFPGRLEMIKGTQPELQLTQISVAERTLFLQLESGALGVSGPSPGLTPPGPPAMMVPRPLCAR